MCMALFWRPPRCPDGGPFGPKWGWHLRRVHIFKRFVFNVFSKIHAIRRVLRSSGGFWPSPGTLWGSPGPHRQTKVTTTLRPVLGRVLRVRAGAQWSTRPQITMGICAECLRRDRRVFKTLVKHKGLESFWHPRGPSHRENACVCVCFIRAAASPKKLPRRACTQNLRK